MELLRMINSHPSSDTEDKAKINKLEAELT